MVRMSGVPGGRAGWPTHGGCVWDGAAAAADGWRVMTLGTRTTSFLIFFTEYVVVCYEERVDPTTDHAAVLPLLAPPSATVPAPEPAPGHGGHSAGGASGASGAKSLPAPPRLRHRRPAIGATDVSGCPSRSSPWMSGAGPTPSTASASPCLEVSGSTTTRQRGSVPLWHLGPGSGGPAGGGAAPCNGPVFLFVLFPGSGCRSGRGIVRGIPMVGLVEPFVLQQLSPNCTEPRSLAANSGGCHHAWRDFMQPFPRRHRGQREHTTSSEMPYGSDFWPK